SFIAVHGHAISGNVMANDSDPDGDTLQVAATTITTAGGGVVTLSSDGSFTYEPAAKFVGADTFDYTLLDGSTSSVGTVTLNMINHAPSAVSDILTGFFGQPLTGNVLANDSDADGDSLSATATVATTTNGGTIDLAADGSFTYTPFAGFVGSDFFTYTVNDGFRGSSTATLIINYAAPAAARIGTN